MDFSFTDEQEMLREQVRSFLASELPAERVAELTESAEGWDASSWSQMAELGWTGLSIPEEQGGSGMDFIDEALLFDELGYGLYTGPYFSTIGLSLPALQGADEVLSAVASGAARATVAFAEPDGARSLEDVERITTSAERAGDGWVVTGDKELVPDLAPATHVVVTAGGDEGAGLWLVEPNSDARTTVETVDATRRLGRLRLERDSAALLVEPGHASSVLSHVRRRADAALALEAVGIAQRALELARDYAKERKQFDKPIGSYQAVSHQVADIYVSAELARSLAYWAAWCIATSNEGADRAAAAAKALAAEAAVAACERSIQVHGGIGFTWEHPLHRYYKRALWIASFNGTPSTQRALVASSLLDA